MPGLAAPFKDGGYGSNPVDAVFEGHRYLDLPSTTFYDASTQTYLVDNQAQLRMTLDFLAKETDDGYQYVQVLTDKTTCELCLPVVAGFECMQGAQSITIGTTDTHKTLDSLSHVWSELQRMGATRHSLLVNLGGGMVTDLGGFAASTFKRGIAYINIPTTLLSMVDASVGG